MSTAQSSAAGTLAFKPPEVFADVKSDSMAGDIYAVGVTMYLMLTEVFPYALPDDLAHISPDDFEKQPRRPEELNLDADAAIGDIVMRCLCRDPADRYRDAQSLLADLEAWGPQPPRENEDGLSSAKDIAGTFSQHCETAASGDKALEMAKEAIRLAKEEARLSDAADMMEEAFSLSPALRDKYASRVKLWRAGVSCDVRIVPHRNLAMVAGKMPALPGELRTFFRTVILQFSRGRFALPGDGRHRKVGRSSFVTLWTCPRFGQRGRCPSRRYARAGRGAPSFPWEHGQLARGLRWRGRRRHSG